MYFASLLNVVESQRRVRYLRQSLYVALFPHSLRTIAVLFTFVSKLVIAEQYSLRSGLARYVVRNSTGTHVGSSE